MTATPIAPATPQATLIAAAFPAMLFPAMLLPAMLRLMALHNVLGEFGQFATRWCNLLFVTTNYFLQSAHRPLRMQPAAKLTAGKLTAGKPAGKQTAGKQTAGKQTAGKQTAGKQTAGNPQAIRRRSAGQ